jgi:hypothetical protein
MNRYLLSPKQIHAFYLALLLVGSRDMVKGETTLPDNRKSLNKCGSQIESSLRKRLLSYHQATTSDF